MGISYNKLWKLLIDKGMTKNTLRSKGIHPSVIAKMGKNERVSMEVLENLCSILSTDIGDLVEYIQDDTKQADE